MFNKDYILQCNKYLTVYFFQQLQKSEQIKQTILNRGITESIINKFCLGYCSGDDNFLPFCEQKNISIDFLVHFGLITDSFTKRQVFKNRIMIPIPFYNQIVGFTARTTLTDPTISKYINSKANILFNKESMLYPIYNVYKFLAHDGCILVEGCFDVLTLLSQGIKNVIAVNGTNISKKQIRLISRWTDKAYICFDADETGINKAREMERKFLQSEFSTKIVKLPEGDPDEFVLKYGKQKFLDLLE